MKLPRWISDVRVVESQMGWPLKLSKRFVSDRDTHNFAGDAMQLWPLTVIGCIVGVGTCIALMFEVAGDLPLGLGLPLVLAPLLVFPMLPTLLYSMQRRARLHRALADFRAAPWCLRCRYPVLSAAPGAGSPVCPECGELIPPEIATLAAGRAERAERREGATAET